MFMEDIFQEIHNGTDKTTYISCNVMVLLKVIRHAASSKNMNK